MKKRGSRKKSLLGPGNGGDTRRQAHWLLNEGARLLRQRQPGEAVDRLEQARQLAPTLVEVAINLGGAYVMQGRHAEAAAVLEEASRLEPAPIT